MMGQRLRKYRLALIGPCLGWMLGALGPAAPARAENIFLTTPLATKTPDNQLINPWGISASGMSPFWISNNGAGVSTLYSVDPTTNVATQLSRVVTIPGDGSVTGQVFNSAAGTGAFNGDTFLFVSEDG